MAWNHAQRDGRNAATLAGPCSYAAAGGMTRDLGFFPSGGPVP